jgi:OmpA-OmpF porin, OOP family
MSKNPDTFEMLDTSPSPSPRGKVIGLAAGIVVVAAAVAIYFLAVKKPAPATGETAAGTTAGAPAPANAAGTPNPSVAPNPSGGSSTPTPPATPSGAPATTPAGTGGTASAPAPKPAPGAAANATVHFGFNQASLRARDRATLAALQTKLKGSSGTLVIEGYTDDIGSDAYNQKLAEKRAQSVAALFRKRGAQKPYQVSIRALGEAQPVANNNTEEGRAANRRAVISINQ